MTVKRTVAIVLFILLIGNIPLMAGADTYELGDKVSELPEDPQSDVWMNFEYGWVFTNVDYKNQVPLIFDNNSNTGIDNAYSPGHSVMEIKLMFHHPLNVTNITVRPNFGAGASTYIFRAIVGNYEFVLADQIDVNATFEVNATLNGVSLTLDSFGSNHFSFNDVLINYTPSYSNLDDLWAEIQKLKSNISQLQDQLDDITDIVNDINSSVTNMNVTQQLILQNLTDLWYALDNLNQSIVSLYEDFNNLNISAPENITIIE